MPKYKNSTDTLIVVGQHRFEPLQAKTIEEFLADLPDGLTLVSVTPVNNKIILDQTSIANSGETVTINVPEEVNDKKVRKYSIKIKCTVGGGKIKYGNTNYAPYKTLLATGVSEFLDKIMDRTVDTILIESTINSSSFKIELTFDW